MLPRISNTIKKCHAPGLMLIRIVRHNSAGNCVQMALNVSSAFGVAATALKLTGKVLV
jgi:hypothetical protein